MITTENKQVVAQSSEWCALANEANKDLIPLGLAYEVRPNDTILAQEAGEAARVAREGANRQAFNDGIVAFLKAVAAHLSIQAMPLVDIWPGDATNGYRPMMQMKRPEGNGHLMGSRIEVELYNKSYFRVIIGNYGTKTIYKFKINKVAELWADLDTIRRTAKEVSHRVASEIQGNEAIKRQSDSEKRCRATYEANKATFDVVGVRGYNLREHGEGIFHSDKVNFVGTLEQWQRLTALVAEIKLENKKA